MKLDTVLWVNLWDACVERSKLANSLSASGCSLAAAKAELQKLHGIAGLEYLKLSFLSNVVYCHALSLVNLLVHCLVASEPVILSLYMLKQQVTIWRAVRKLEAWTYRTTMLASLLQPCQSIIRYFQCHRSLCPHSSGRGSKHSLTWSKRNNPFLRSTGSPISSWHVNLGGENPRSWI
jgi:hypothetical protein